jgi:superfamily II DNA or RNA helicase
MTYQELLNRKRVKARDFGIEPKAIHPELFDFQRKAVEFAVRKGRAALFLDTGLGKTICQLEWARQIPGEVLILAPVAVAPQTVREAKDHLGMGVHHSRDGSVRGKVTITNYERMHLFDAQQFAGVVLDESSILKSFAGKTKQQLCDTFKATPYRLACTATPAPNDYMELGNHADFLGVMPSNEMLSRWFINDTMNFGSYRLKGHAVKSFWQWVGSWAVCASMPSDLGGDDERYILPPMGMRLHVVEKAVKPNIETGCLFGHAELSATNMHADKRETMAERVAKAAELADTGDFCLIWCESNAESEALRRAIPDCVEVVGSDDSDAKEAKLDAFSRGEVRVMVTKPSIAGFGLNWQHCNHVIFASLSYSYEAYYQAIRRTWRFGQKRPVQVDAIIADSEQGVWRTVKEKMESHNAMKESMRYAALNSSESLGIKTEYIAETKGKLPVWIK